MAWAWFATDLATGAVAAQLAVTSWSHEERLNDAGTFTATLESQGSLLDRQAIDATLAARSVVVPFRNGLPLGYAGVVWGPDPPAISGSSLLSYFDTQTYDTTRTWTATDQHTMMTDLVGWVQANGGNVRVDTSQVELSYVLRDQTWHVWEQKNVGEAFRQKADNLNGFDFDFRAELDEAGNILRRLRMWTPRRGRPYTESASPVFTVGRNAFSVPSAPADGSEMVTHVIALGADNGTVVTLGDAEVRERLVARSVRTDLLALGYPRLVHVLDRTDLTTQVALQQTADGYASFHGAAEIDEIVLEVDPDDITFPWDSYDLGDDCLVNIPVGVDPWWPTGCQEVRRIVGRRWRKEAASERLEIVTGRPLP